MPSFLHRRRWQVPDGVDPKNLPGWYVWSLVSTLSFVIAGVVAFGAVAKYFHPQRHHQDEALGWAFAAIGAAMIAVLARRRGRRPVPAPPEARLVDD